MIVLNREDFFKMPAGTAYCLGKEWYFEGMAFKGDTINHPERGPIDFFQHNFNWVDGDDSGQCFERLEEMQADGVSYPMQDSEARNGFYDPDQIFLVYEKADLEKLQEYLALAIKCREGQGE